MARLPAGKCVPVGTKVKTKHNQKDSRLTLNRQSQTNLSLLSGKPDKTKRNRDNRQPTCQHNIIVMPVANSVNANSPYLLSSATTYSALRRRNYFTAYYFAALKKLFCTTLQLPKPLTGRKRKGTNYFYHCRNRDGCTQPSIRPLGLDARQARLSTKLHL